MILPLVPLPKNMAFKMPTRCKKRKNVTRIWLSPVPAWVCIWNFPCASQKFWSVSAIWSNLTPWMNSLSQSTEVKSCSALPETIARKIQKTIQDELHLYARIGIGPNKVLSKMACDNFAKKNKEGIYWLDRKKLKTDLWPLPVQNMFGVGKRMGHHLNKMGIRTIGDLARFPLKRLQKRWGIPGQVLWMTANGHDLSPVSPDTFEHQKAIGHQMTLPRDYRTAEEIRVVLLELCEEVCRRTRCHHLLGQTVSVGCRGGDFQNPSGFHRQCKLPEATNQTMEVFRWRGNCFCVFGKDSRSVRWGSA